MAFWEQWSQAHGDQEDDASSLAVAEQQERELILAAQTGDEEAFALLYASHQWSVFRLAFRMVQDHDEAGEIVQDVFLAAWQGLDQFRGEARFGTWLHRIAYRRALRSLEARQQRLATLTRFANEQLERFSNAWSAVQAALAEQQWRQAIQEQVDRLPEKYREILTLRHFQDLSYEEIGLALTLPISSVKTHLFRARAMLRERLQTTTLADRQPSGANLRDQLDHLARDAGELGELVRGHLQQVGSNLDSLRGRVEASLNSTFASDTGA